MKRWMVAICLLSNLSLLHSAEYANKKVENMTQAFEAHPRFAEYNEAMKTSKEKAMQIKKEMAEEITKKLLADMVGETNKLAQKWVSARIENYDIQTKVNLANLYMKSEKVLEPATQKATFNPNLSNLVEAIFYKTWKATELANIIKWKYTFNDNWKFIDELVEISKMSDEISNLDKKIADSDKAIAAWNNILKKLEALAK